MTCGAWSPAGWGSGSRSPVRARPATVTSGHEAVLWLADLAALADLADDTDRAKGVCRDPADDAVLSAAIEGRADVIVTGDGDLLALEEHEGIAIVTPRAFLDLVRG